MIGKINTKITNLMEEDKLCDSMQAAKATTYRHENEDNQGNNNAKNDQFHLHIFNPHLSFHLGALFSKILCLKTIDQVNF